MNQFCVITQMRSLKTHIVKVVHGCACGEVDDELGRLVFLGLLEKQPYQLQGLLCLVTGQVRVLQPVRSRIPYRRWSRRSFWLTNALSYSHQWCPTLLLLVPLLSRRLLIFLFSLASFALLGFGFHPHDNPSEVSQSRQLEPCSTSQST